MSPPVAALHLGGPLWAHFLITEICAIRPQT
jgi:hypothetical protein